MSDNRGTGQGRDPSRPILEGEEPGDAYENEDEILDDLNGLDGNGLDGEDFGDLEDEDGADLEDFDELEDEDEF